MAAPSTRLLVYPDDCDSFGHVNQANFLRLFERARWKALATGPGVDLFTRADAWPAVRRTTIEYHAGVFPGDVLRFDLKLIRVGRTSFSMHQKAIREKDEVLVAEAEFVFVCIKRDGTPTPVPEELKGFLGIRPSMRPSGIQSLAVRGVSMGVDVQGDGDAVLFVHGFPMNRTMWRDMAASLTGYRRVAPDLRGLGLSDAGEDAYSMQEYADDLACLLDLLKIESVVVCGLSMGGYVAFELFRRHRDRVRGLMLLNTRAEKDDEHARRGRDDTISSVRQDGPTVLEDLLIHRLLAKGTEATMPQIVEELRTMIGGHSSAGVVGALNAMKDRSDATDLLSTIDVPTLVVAGREDQLIPLESAQSMANAIPGAQFTAIADSGHVTPMEQPIATGRVVREFLESIP